MGAARAWRWMEPVSLFGAGGPKGLKAEGPAQIHPASQVAGAGSALRPARPSPTRFSWLSSKTGSRLKPDGLSELS